MTPKLKTPFSETYAKVKDCITTCQTAGQFQSAMNYMRLFEKIFSVTVPENMYIFNKFYKTNQ